MNNIPATMNRKNRLTRNIITALPFLVVALLLLALAAVAIQKIDPFKAYALGDQEPAPVILVHGYNNKYGCHGISLDSYWKNAKIELTTSAGIPAKDVIPVSFYKCDTYGIDITGYGPGTSYPFTTTTGTTKPRAGHTNKSSITRVAQDLAWFIHNEYTQKSQPVDVVGHSMGGLITREALRRVQANDPAFPSSIDIQKVLTMSTPHNGWGAQCKSNTQCVEMSDGSAFLAELQTNPAPQGSKGTHWWAMATAGEGTGNGYLTSTCDAIPTHSAIAVGGTDLVYTKPCYRHNAYLNDRSQKLDAEGSAELGGRHSLAMMVEILR